MVRVALISCAIFSCLFATAASAQNNGFRLAQLDPRVPVASGQDRPSSGPGGEPDFTAGLSLVNGWNNVAPTEVYLGWNFFSAMGYEEAIVRRTLQSILQGPVRYLPVRAQSREYNANGRSGTEVRYLIGVCLESSEACRGGEPVVDALLALTSVEGRPPFFWMQFFGRSGSRYCWLMDDGWNCKAPPGGWRNRPYTLYGDTNVSRMVGEVAEGWQRGGPGLLVSDVFGPVGGSPSPYPEPHEVRCMMREIAC